MKFPKTMGGWVGLVLKISGALVVANPLIRSIDVTTPANIPKNIMYNYTGLSLDSGSWNAGAATTGIGSIIGGIALAKAGSFVAKSLR